METLAALGAGFSVALSPENLLWCLLGTSLGTAIGVLPGLGHCPHDEAPELVNSILLEWIKDGATQRT